MAAAAFLPCEWFGTRFEGSCGYAIALLAVFVGLNLGLLIFVRFYRMTANRVHEAPHAWDAAIRRYKKIFWTCFVLHYVGVLADPYMLIGVGPLVLAGILWATVELAVRMKRSAWTPLAFLVPVIGHGIVAWVLFNDPTSRKTHAAQRGE